MSVSMSLCNFSRSLNENRDEKSPSLCIITSSKAQKRQRNEQESESKSEEGGERSRDNTKTKKQSKLVLCATVGYFIACRSFVAGSHPIWFGVCMRVVLVLFLLFCWSKILLGALFMDSFFFFFFFSCSLCHSTSLARPSLSHSVSSLTNFIVIQHTQLFICSQNIFSTSSSSSLRSFIVLFVFDLNLSLGQPTIRPTVCLSLHSTTSYLLVHTALRIFELLPKYFYFQSQNNLVR